MCKMVRAAGDAGIPAIKYFLCEMENQRTESVPMGRGDVSYSTFNLRKPMRLHRAIRILLAPSKTGSASHFLRARHSSGRKSSGADGLSSL